VEGYAVLIGHWGLPKIDRRIYDLEDVWTLFSTLITWLAIAQRRLWSNSRYIYANDEHSVRYYGLVPADLAAGKTLSQKPTVAWKRSNHILRYRNATSPLQQHHDSGNTLHYPHLPDEG
jgi:hypothetical protein